MQTDPSFRMTRQRRTILSELARTAAHPTADELYQAVRRHLPRISLGTVYRNLEIMVRAGMVRRLDGGTQRRYDATTGHHYHVRCRQCGRVDDLAIPAAESLEAAARAACDYEITGHELEFAGLCPHCRKASERPL